MQEKHLYEYAVIRLVPRVEREEFVNVGIILFCKRSKFISVKYHLDTAKILAMHSETDLDQVQMNLEAFSKVAFGGRQGGPIAGEDLPSRFRWLTATRSSIIQTSKTHPGVTGDLNETVMNLFEKLVL